MMRKSAGPAAAIAGQDVMRIRHEGEREGWRWSVGNKLFCSGVCQGGWADGSIAKHRAYVLGPG